MLRPQRDFVDRIAQYGLSITELAERAGVSRYTIHRWFNADRPAIPRRQVAWRVTYAYAGAAKKDPPAAFQELFTEVPAEEPAHATS